MHVYGFSPTRFRFCGSTDFVQLDLLEVFQVHGFLVHGYGTGE